MLHEGFCIGLCVHVDEDFVFGMVEYLDKCVIKLRIGDMLFTWDDEKERINIRKHSVDFRTAAAVFLDGDAVEEENSVDEYTGEIRMDTIGAATGLSKLLFVVYVERIKNDTDDIIRIISARKAEREERIRYVNGA